MKLMREASVGNHLFDAIIPPAAKKFFRTIEGDPTSVTTGLIKEVFGQFEFLTRRFAR
jgi:hypothetical protein